jgi:hypothetical protein
MHSGNGERTMRTHSPLQQFKEAKQIADDHGMFVVKKG